MPSQTSGGKGTNSMTEQRPPYKTNAPVPRAFSIKVYPTRVHLGFIGPAGAVEISYARTPLDSLAKTVEKYSLSLTTQHEGYPKESRYIISMLDIITWQTAGQVFILTPPSPITHSGD